MRATDGSGSGGSEREVLDIAVVGSGIAGMSCAWLLSQWHRVTLYEAAPRLGGHTNTVRVAGAPPIDTGFIVYNEATYPNLTALFRHLGVATRATEMSFAVSLDDGGLEYSGTNLRGLFAQKGNLLSPRFWAMLRDLLRFYRDAPGDSAALEEALTPLGTYLDARGYHPALQQDHLLPMAAAIWSSPAGRIRDYPAAAFIRFCETHGLLKVANRPLWRTVVGGSQTYIAPLTAPYAERIRLGAGIRTVQRDPDGVTLTGQGFTERHDHVVLATHADQALNLLADADREERMLLGSFRPSPNRAVLHTDPSLMPRRRAVWSAWNYLGERGSEAAPCVTYWMNRLQDLPGKTQYFVTLNPPRPPAPGTLLHEEAYEHPLFDAGALGAQRRLWSLQGRRRAWFCGAWFGAGFHEDGLQAGLAVAEALGAPRRPWMVENESGRIALGPLAAPDWAEATA